MSISAISNSSDLMGAAAQIAQGTTAQGASMGVLKKALDASSAEASDLASMVAQSTGAGSLLNVHA
jgi:hypothetical protein